jgi:predicted DNA-binding transcriptional regulator AlpA
MSDAIPTAPPDPRRVRRRRVAPGLLRRKDAAQYCGVGPSTWDRLVAAGMTPAAIKLGGSVCWSRHELAEWCRRGCPPRSEWEPIWAALLARRSALRR